MKRLASALVVLSLLAGLCKNRPNNEKSCLECLSSYLTNYYMKLGEEGVGDSFKDISDNIILTRRSDLGRSQYWDFKALMAGSARENLKYAEDLEREAKRRPYNSPSRKIMLNEAKNRIEIAFKNSFIMRDMSGPAMDERQKFLDAADDVYIRIGNDLQARR